MTREVLITGIGLISCLGEGEDAHWTALSEGHGPAPDNTLVPPFFVHPMCKLDLARYIPNKSDQRAMGPFMHYGVYAAGMALADAGIAGDKALLSRTHLIAGCGGGERDPEVDEKLMAMLPKANDPGRLLNETLMTDLRPTLFLAQLPNLFAGNISIVHGVTGSSCTFMGEEMAGVDALRIAFERIAADQGDLFLVGSAFNAVRKDLALLFAAGSYLARDKLEPLWSSARKGMALGSMGSFLVLESRTHAEARGKAPIARLLDVVAGRSDRKAGAARRVARAQWEKMSRTRSARPPAILSGATGAVPATWEEHAFLASFESAAVRGTAAALGHGMECAFLANIALAAAAARRRKFFAPLDPDEPIERPREDVEQILVTQWGHHRGEAMALVASAAGGDA